jgi:hypothetical protein
VTQFEVGSAEISAVHGHDRGYRPESTHEGWWTGWIAFAGLMMLLLGSFHAMQGLVALFNDEYFLVAESGLVLPVDYTSWGLTHLVLGILVAASGVGVLTGSTAARVVGTLMAMLSAVVNLAFLAAYPLWSVIMITLDVLVVLALTVHGSAVRDPES